MTAASLIVGAGGGIPAYAILTTPATAWKDVDFSEFQPTELAVTRVDDRPERLWLHRKLGELHHPHPDDPGDDVFEEKFAVAALDLDGHTVDAITYYVDMYRAGEVRVGDFEFDDAPAPTSESKTWLKQRLAGNSSEVEPNLLSIWERSVAPSSAAVRIESRSVQLELSEATMIAEEDAWLGELLKAVMVTAPQSWSFDSQRYFHQLTRVEVFRLPSGAWLAACQLMDSGVSYDIGVVFARSTDAGRSWQAGGLLPRLDEGSGFFLSAAGVSAIAESPDGRLWLASSYNLSTALGRPSGAPGQIAVSTDGGLSWTDASFHSPVTDYSSFSGIAVDAVDPQRIVVSVEDRQATNDRPGPAIWLTENGGRSWRAVEQGLYLDPVSRVEVIWVGAGPRIVAAIRRDSELRPIVFRHLTFMERVRGDLGLQRHAAQRPNMTSAYRHIEDNN